jgi:hypothetical protein
VHNLRLVSHRMIAIKVWLLRFEWVYDSGVALCAIRTFEMPSIRMRACLEVSDIKGFGI